MAKKSGKADRRAKQASKAAAAGKSGGGQQKGAARARSRKGASMPFSRTNYLFLLGCLALIVFGFAIMRMENEVDGMISLFVAPPIILFGYLAVFYAIMKRSDGTAKSKVEEEAS